jgi:hypothetical protein
MNQLREDKMAVDRPVLAETVADWVIQRYQRLVSAKN